MTEMPTVWLWVSGIFFVLQSIFVIALTIAVFKLIQAIQQITPKVQAISDKVHDIGDKVEDLTANVKTTLEVVGGRAKSVAGSADLIAHTASRTFEKFSPVVIGILSALRILKALQEFRGGKSPAEATKAKTLEKGAPREAAKVDKKGGK
jgi:phage-related protein